MMEFSPRELSFLKLALEAQIKKCENFYERVEAGEFPGYGADELRMGKELNEERKALLARMG